MNTDELREFWRRRPFEPFEIVLIDGRTFPVRHPEMILVPQGRVSWIYVDDGHGRVEHINTLVISSVRNLRKPGTGRSKGRKAS